MKITYRTNEYIELLNTYSSNLSMEEKQRTKLFENIAQLIDDQFGGNVTKHYAISLTIGMKVS